MKKLIILLFIAGLSIASTGFVGGAVGTNQKLSLSLEKNFTYKSEKTDILSSFESASFGLTYQRYSQDNAIGISLGKEYDLAIYNGWGVCLSTNYGLVYLTKFERGALLTGLRCNLYYSFIETYIEYRNLQFSHKTYNRTLNGLFVGVGLRL